MQLLMSLSGLHRQLSKKIARRLKGHGISFTEYLVQKEQPQHLSQQQPQHLSQQLSQQQPATGNQPYV